MAFKNGFIFLNVSRKLVEFWLKKECDLGNGLQLIHALDSVVSYNQSILEVEPAAGPGNDS